MRTSHSFATGIAEAAYLALFPGFFFYQTAIGAGLMPPVLGGYFSIVALAFAPLLLCCYVHAAMGRAYLNGVDIVFWCFITYFFMVMAFQYANGADTRVVAHHALAILSYTVLFMVFRLADFTGRRIRLLSFATLALMTAIIFIMSRDGAFQLRLSGDGDANDALATYQGFARSYIVVLLAVIPFIRSLPRRLLLYAVCIPALWINGARSELVATVAAISMIEALNARNRFLCVAISGALLGAVFLFSEQLLAMLPDTRQTQLFNITQATSWEARVMLHDFAVRTIAEHPLLGEYGSYLRVMNHPGSYAHNLLSAWVDLGVTGFVLLLGMLAVPMATMTTQVLGRAASAQWPGLMMAFCLMFVTLLLVVASKGFTYMLIGAAVGLYANYRSVFNHAQNRSPHFRASPLRHPNLHQAMPQPGAPRL